jgi:hypothetical protein
VNHRTPEAAARCRNRNTKPSSVGSASTQADADVCVGADGLQDRGEGFYKTFRHVMLTDGRMSIDPLTLAGQLRTLATVGAPLGQTDGAAAINAASSDVRLALTKMVRDAERLAPHFADIANGLPTSGPDSELQPLISSFTAALIACRRVGQSPTWFNLDELTGY